MTRVNSSPGQHAISDCHGLDNPNDQHHGPAHHGPANFASAFVIQMALNAGRAMIAGIGLGINTLRDMPLLRGQEKLKIMGGNLPMIADALVSLGVGVGVVAIMLTCLPSSDSLVSPVIVAALALRFRAGHPAPPINSSKPPPCGQGC